MSDLAGARTRARNPADFEILPETISKEPLGPSVRRGDDEWFQIVRWSFYAMVEAEENGITKANVDQIRASSKVPQVMRRVMIRASFWALIRTGRIASLSKSATTAKAGRPISVRAPN